MQHLKQYDMAGEYVKSKDPMAGEFLNGISIDYPKLSRGLYYANPAEAHAYYSSRFLVKELKRKGFFDE
jgi:hypothetical protein